MRNSCPGAGACGGMYTANTMASSIEAMGMTLPYRYGGAELQYGIGRVCGSVPAALCLPELLGATLQSLPRVLQLP